MSIQNFQQTVQKLVDNYPSNPHYIVPWTVVWFVYGNVICRIPCSEKYDAYMEVEKIMRLYEGSLENLKDKLNSLVTIEQEEIIEYIQFITDYLRGVIDENITISEIKDEDKNYIQTLFDEFNNFDFEELDEQVEFDFLLPYLKPLLDCAK